MSPSPLSGRTQTPSGSWRWTACATASKRAQRRLRQGLFLRTSWSERRPLLPVHEVAASTVLLRSGPAAKPRRRRLLADVGEPTGDEARCAGDAVATYSRGDTVLSR